MKTQEQIPVTSYKASGFTEKYQNIVRSTVIPYQYSVLWDKADGAEKSHVAANFINAAKALRGEDPGDGFTEWYFRTAMLTNGLKRRLMLLRSVPMKSLNGRLTSSLTLSPTRRTRTAISTHFSL